MGIRKLNERDWRDNIAIELTNKKEADLLKEFFCKNDISIDFSKTLFNNGDDNKGYLFLEIVLIAESKDLEDTQWTYLGPNTRKLLARDIVSVDKFIKLYNINSKVSLLSPSFTINTIEDAPRMIKELNKIMMNTFGMNISISLNIPNESK